MPDRYPGYDVLTKRHTPSWNEQTRRAIDERLAIPREPRFFTEAEWATLNAVCNRIIPQPPDRPPVPLPALVDHKLHTDERDGYRDHRLPRMQEAWRRGLHALDEAARARGFNAFHAMPTDTQDVMLHAMQCGELNGAAWDDMPSDVFFHHRVLHDIVNSYYSHPIAWNEIGFGGPASPRGYVRMGFNRRDPWEAAEAHPGKEDEALRKNRRVG